MRSQTIRESVLGPEHPDVATSLNGMATLYESQVSAFRAFAERLYGNPLTFCRSVKYPSFLEHWPRGFPPQLSDSLFQYDSTQAMASLRINSIARR